MSSGMVIPEAQVLRPKADGGGNQTPELFLSNVEVVDKDSNKPCSLLSVDSKRPARVTGELSSVPKKHHRLLLQEGLLPTTLEINDVNEWSYGQFDDGSIAIFVIGKSGLYQIEPSARYSRTYLDMLEAVRIFYHIVDTHEGKIKTHLREVTADMILRKYAEEPSHRCRSAHQAALLFTKHSSALLELLAKDRQGVDWKETPIHRYLTASAEDESEEDDDSDSLDEDDDEIPATLAGRGKSAMRPRGSGYASKSLTRRRSPFEEDDDGDRAMTAIEQNSLKRKVADIQQGRPLKRRTLVQPASSRVSHVTVKLPKAKDTPGGRAAIVSRPMPSFVPGKDGVWRCDFDGCSHKVYDAANPDVRYLIEEHFRDHASKAQQQLDLLIEEERPDLPVSNLAKKIRELAAQKQGSPSQQASTETDNNWPKPIKQRY